MTSALASTVYCCLSPANQVWNIKGRIVMKSAEEILDRRVNRRSFIKNGAIAAGTVTAGAALLSHGLSAFGQDSSGSLTKGDIAILRFLAAAELIESDLWTQYAQLGGLTPGQVPPEVN